MSTTIKLHLMSSHKEAECRNCIMEMPMHDTNKSFNQNGRPAKRNKEC